MDFMDAEKSVVIGPNHRQGRFYLGLVENQPGQVLAGVHVGQIVEKQEKPVEIVGMKGVERCFVILFDFFGKGHDMGFDDFQAPLAILAAAQKLVRVQFVVVMVVYIMHGMVAWIEC